MVLLKNDNETLPISPSVTKVAVLGATVPYKTTTTAGTTRQAASSTSQPTSAPATWDRAASSPIPTKDRPVRGLACDGGMQRTTAPSRGVTVVATAPDASPDVARATPISSS